MATRKQILRRVGLSAFAVFVLAAIFLGRPVCLWINAWLHDRPTEDETRPGYVDDAGRLNSTRVAEVWSIPADANAAEKQLRELLLRARRQHQRVAIGGARHSMGGQTIYPDGIVIDMLPFHSLKLDEDRHLLHVGSGARWSEVVPYLDARGFSVAVMQASNDFTVGGSVSVNCHGWQPASPPIASTVDSLRLMKADGVIVRCSRTENADLFSLVLGGYGLFGVILDVDLRIVPNERYRPEVETLPVEQFSGRFAEKVGEGNVGLAYGRLCVVPGDETFLREALLTVFRRAPCEPGLIPPLAVPAYSLLRREMYRAQIGSNAGKEVRWKAEQMFGADLGGKYFSRNQLMNEGSDVYREHNADRTDILQEYFVPQAQLANFLERARAIIPRHDVDLLNVTVRDVREDKDCFLRYADKDMFALVMLFNQPRTAEADGLAEQMARELVGAALACGGRYYLPYRLQATGAQFAECYPQAARFFEQKRTIDPDETFQNQFYLKYGRP